MSRARATSTTDPSKSTTPHSVSLKVLRLSRPTLSEQWPLPRSVDDHLLLPQNSGYSVPPSAEQRDTRESPFMLSGALRLPEAFGNAYVGETFSCTICANDELGGGTRSADGKELARERKIVRGVRMGADMQTPNNPNGLTLSLEGTDPSPDPSSPDSSSPNDLAQAQGNTGSLQKILRYELNEEGAHVLAVTVTYTESLVRDGEVMGGRSRSFRKLYQFMARGLMGVRTKACEMKNDKVGPKDSGGKKRKRERYTLEAQLENIGEVGVVLDSITILPNPVFCATSLNLDVSPNKTNAPILNPRDIMQVAFLMEKLPDSKRKALEEDENQEGRGSVDVPRLSEDDKRTVLGQLLIQWRGGMGEKGSLKTAWLTSRGR